MRNTQSFEVSGIGDFEVFPIKAEDIEVKTITQDGKPLIRVSPKVERATAYWVDESGTQYTEEQVFYEIANQKVQKIKRTDVVKKHEVVEQISWQDLTDEVNTAVLSCSETTKENFKAKVGESKAIKFKIKKADRGFKFYWAYIYQDGNNVVMTTGLGSKKQGIEQFNQLQANKGKAKDIKSVLEVSACDIEVDI